MKRRTFLAAAAVGALFGTVSRAEERVIKVLARKFEFVPSEITLKKGEPVVLEITSDEVTMGFYCKELNASAEIPPGKPVQVRLAPAQEGTFVFICDVFCGDGHEDMAGKIHVTA
jgi:cytochrome c oxidase subunit 2